MGERQRTPYVISLREIHAQFPQERHRLFVADELRDRLLAEGARHVHDRAHQVLVDATSRRREWELTGRTSGNTVVNFPGPPEWLGALVDVTIRRAGPNSVWGEPVSAAALAGRTENGGAFDDRNEH